VAVQLIKRVEINKMKYIASKKALSVKQGDNKVEVPSEFPQYDTLAEIVQVFGGDEDKVRDYINSSVQADSAIPCRVYANSTAGKLLTAEQLIAKCAEIRKNFNPATSGRSSILTASAAKDFGKTIAEAFTSGKELSSDEIRALIEAARNS
jgi:hypothetical protein